MTPYAVAQIADREGNVLEENRPEPHEAIRADTAFVMTNLLRGVVQRGTASSAAALDWPLAGKTGTMDDYTDAWFVGFDPEHHGRRLGGLRREEAARHRRDRRHGRAADLDRLHAGVHRDAATARIRRSSSAGQHRVPDARSRERRSCRRGRRGHHRGVHHRHAAGTAFRTDFVRPSSDAEARATEHSKHARHSGVSARARSRPEAADTSAKLLVGGRG